MLAPIGRKLFPEPGQYGFRDISVGDQFGDDSFQQPNLCPLVFSRLSQGRTPALDFADDREAKAVEGAHRYAVCRVAAEPIADPFLHLLPSIPCESQQQQFRGTPIASA